MTSLKQKYPLKKTFEFFKSGHIISPLEILSSWEGNRMDVRIAVVGYLDTNCYIVTDGANREAVIIDPGADASSVLKHIEKNKLDVKAILITHGHNDHIGALHELNRKLQVPMLIHEKEADYARIPQSDRKPFAPGETSTAFLTLKDGDEVRFGDSVLKTLHTPGHTPGGVCFYSINDRICFSGDTLFSDGVGRTDFEGGDSRALMNSIKTKLLTMPDNVKIYPGHGPSSTIGAERRYF